MDSNRYTASIRFSVIPDEKPIHHHRRVTQSSPVHVHLTFFCETIERYMSRQSHNHSNPRGLRIIREVRRTQETHQCLDAGTLISDRASLDIVKEKLSGLRIDDELHNHVFFEILCWGRKVLGWESNVGRKVIPLRVNILLVRTHVYDQRDLMMRRALMRSMEDSNNNCGMVPASESSVRDLKRKRLTYSDLDDEEECNTMSKITCTVCLEDLPKGTEVTCMPCSHVFHPDCIGTWLEKSHYCPICRFELPTDSNTKPGPDSRASRVATNV